MGLSSSQTNLWGHRSIDEDQGFYIDVNRNILERQWMADVKKRKPRFYTYNLCKKTVQSENMWKTKQEWKDWISQGEKRNRWIPSDPEAVYRELGTWISWNDFLGVDPENEDSIFN